MLVLSEEETKSVLDSLPFTSRKPPIGRKAGIKNYDMASRVRMGIGAAVRGVKKTAAEETSVETVTGDIVPVTPSLPTVASSRDGKIGKRPDAQLSSQVELGLRHVEEIGVGILEKCLDMVSDEELEELSVSSRVGVGVSVATILDKVSKHTDKSEQGITMNFYAPEAHKTVTDYGEIIDVPREAGE